MDTTEIQIIIRNYSQSLYTNEIDNLEVMAMFLGKYTLPRLNQEELENIKGQVTSTEFKTVIKNLPTSKTQSQMASRVNSTKWLCCAVFSCSVSSDSATPRTVACQAPLSEEIPQARILERGSLTSSRRSSQHRDKTQVFPNEGGFFTV